MSDLKPYSGARCMCLLTGCNAGPGCPHYTSNCKAHIAHQNAQPAQAGQVLTVDDLWTSDTIMALNAELGLSIDQIAKFARAIEQAVLAKRVPMTPEETDAAMKLLFYPARNRAFIDGVEAAELHHGIVGEKDTPHGS